MKIISFLVSIGESLGLRVEYLLEEEQFIFSDPDDDSIHFIIDKDKFSSFLDSLDHLREWI